MILNTIKTLVANKFQGILRGHMVRVSEMDKRFKIFEKRRFEAAGKIQAFYQKRFENKSKIGFPCPDCIEGCGKMKGHRGGHRIKKMVDKSLPCPDCVQGCGKMNGHRGGHKKHIKTVVDKSLPCPDCVQGCGKMTGHRGGHKKRVNTVVDNNLPCPDCIEGCGKMKGHRGGHKTKVAKKKADDGPIRSDEPQYLSGSSGSPTNNKNMNFKIQPNV